MDDDTAWPHGPLREFLPDLFYVVGTNRVHHGGMELQTSRTMLVVREGDTLTLVNTVRLDVQGLSHLETLGRVKHVLRLGAFHGRDDPFYRDRYDATLWALPGSAHADGRAPAQLLGDGGALPLSDARLLRFLSASQPEAALHLSRHDGVLVTCDAIQNWREVDPFFSPQTGALFASLGLFGEANVPSTWREACTPHRDDFDRLLALPFRHLVSAHGEPLLDDAHARVAASVARVFG